MSGTHCLSNYTPLAHKILKPFKKIAKEIKAIFRVKVYELGEKPKRRNPPLFSTGPISKRDSDGKPTTIHYDSDSGSTMRYGSAEVLCTQQAPSKIESSGAIMVSLPSPIPDSYRRPTTTVRYETAEAVIHQPKPSETQPVWFKQMIDSMGKPVTPPSTPTSTLGQGPAALSIPDLTPLVTTNCTVGINNAISDNFFRPKSTDK